MKKDYLFIGMLGLALIGCEKKETDKAIHFGPSPGDGEVQSRAKERELHFGPTPGDGATQEDEESLHFGTSPGDP